MSHVPNEVLTSTELALLSGFDRRHIPRKAKKGEIPDARLTKSGRRWEFPMTENLRAWICFYRVRHALLRKTLSFRDDQILREWGTDWQIALATHRFLTGPPSWFDDSGPLGTFRSGKHSIWDAVEAAVLGFGLMPDKKYRSELIKSCR